MAATDSFNGLAPGLSSPAEHAAEVTPNDSADLAYVTRGFRVGTTAGAVKVTTAAGETLTIPGVQIGEVVPLRVTRIWSNGTTAAGITAFW